MIAISPDTHYELYHDWRKALEFCRRLPEVPPSSPTAFHMFWRERRGRFRRIRPFGRKQALAVKSFFATQDLDRCSLTLWSDADLSGSEWLKPFAPRMTLRVYDPEREAHGTILEGRSDLYRQRDKRVYRDGDLFRLLVLHNYGGVYVDMDVVLLRSFGALLDQEFAYQWEDYDHDYNNAVIHLAPGGAVARELLQGVVELAPHDSNWGRANFRRAIDRGVPLTIFPAPFFDTEWHADKNFEPFRRSPASRNLYDGAFAWHWHNRWDDRIAAGCKFQVLEERIDARLAQMGLAA